MKKKKAPGLLIDAFLQVKDPNVHLLLVGNGVLENSLREKGVGNKNIHFMDFQNQSVIPVVYQACDVFCLPSKGPGETWGLAINEAMACKKAIIASDKCGCAIDLVKHENGIIFKNGDINELLSALNNLTNNPWLLLKYGERSRAIINNWDFEHIATAIETKLKRYHNIR